MSILLSTYNGERYLAALLDSVFQQSYKNFSVYIRDDGSSDNTLSIIKQYSLVYPNLFWVTGKNIGVRYSFITLLRDIAPISPFYAFCDQDDSWLPNKLTQAIAVLNALKNPALGLYCCRQCYTDPLLNPRGLSGLPRYFDFSNAIIENTALGCTQVFGVAIREKMLKANPNTMMMHDWWAYLVATAFGNAQYDPEPLILYRQHADNVVGGGRRISKRVAKILGFARNLSQKNGLESLRQAECFLQTYPELPLEKTTCYYSTNSA